jgi:hypothetical protein
MARVVGPAKIEVQKCHLAGHGRGFQLNVGGVGWPSGLDGRLCTARDCRVFDLGERKTGCQRFGSVRRVLGASSWCARTSSTGRYSGDLAARMAGGGDVRILRLRLFGSAGGPECCIS